MKYLLLTILLGVGATAGADEQQIAYPLEQQSGEFAGWSSSTPQSQDQGQEAPKQREIEVPVIVDWDSW